LTIYFKIECEKKLKPLAIEKHNKNMKSKVYIENLLRYPEISIKLLENIKFNNHHKIIDLKSQYLGSDIGTREELLKALQQCKGFLF
jgi:hypothetical protein